MTPQKLVDGELVDITYEEARRAQASWEYYRGSSGEPLARLVAPDGAVLEQDVVVEEKALAEKERADLRQSLKDEAAAAIQTLASNSQGQAALDLLIMLSHELGPIPLSFARNNGWIPPWNRT